MRAFLSLLVALIVFTSLSARGDWTLGAWPSTNSFTFGDPALYLTTTNYMSRKISVAWEQESTGTDIPEVDISFGPFGDLSSGCSDLTRLYPSLELFSFSGTIPSYSNSIRSWDSDFLYITQAEVPPNTLTNNGIVGNVFEPPYRWSWQGRTNGTIPGIAYNYADTNEFEYVEEIVIGPTTNLVTNVVTTIVSGSASDINSTNDLDVPFVWAHDTYLALRERWVFRNPTNDFFTEAPGYLKPLQHGTKTLVNIYNEFIDRWCRTPVDVQKHNLYNFKHWIKSELGSGAWVDKTQADTNGLLETYFNSNLVWQFTVDPVTLSNKWQKTGKRTNFPRYRFERNRNDPPLSFTNIPGFPYEIVTNSFTNVVDGLESPAIRGWETSPPLLFEEFAPIGSTYTKTNLSLTKTWFDWTPDDDLGGWLPQLSNTVVDGIHEIPIDMTLYPTTAVYITDSCGGIPDYLEGNTPNRADYYYFRLHTTNLAGEVDSVDFSLYKIGTPDSLIAAATYVEPTVYTNYFTCTNSYIAKGFTEANYGYAIMPQMVDLLHWTASDNFMLITNISERDLDWERDAVVTNYILGGTSIKTGTESFWEFDGTPGSVFGCNNFTDIRGPYQELREEYFERQEDNGGVWDISNSVPTGANTVLRRYRERDEGRMFYYFLYAQGSYGFDWSELVNYYTIRLPCSTIPLPVTPKQCVCDNNFCYRSEVYQDYSVSIPQQEWYNSSGFSGVRDETGFPIETDLYDNLSAVSDLYRFDSSITFEAVKTNSGVGLNNTLPEDVQVDTNCWVTYETDFFTPCETFDCISGLFNFNTENGGPNADFYQARTQLFNIGGGFISPDGAYISTSKVFYANSFVKATTADEISTYFEYPLLTEPSEADYLVSIYDFYVDETGVAIYPFTKSNDVFYTDILEGALSDGFDETKFKVLHKWDFKYQYPF